MDRFGFQAKLIQHSGVIGVGLESQHNRGNLSLLISTQT